jgi:hypothetical protein
MRHIRSQNVEIALFLNTGLVQKRTGLNVGCHEQRFVPNIYNSFYSNKTDRHSSDKKLSLALITVTLVTGLAG